MLPMVRYFVYIYGPYRFTLNTLKHSTFCLVLLCHNVNAISTIFLCIFDMWVTANSFILVGTCVVSLKCHGLNDQVINSIRIRNKKPDVSNRIFCASRERVAQHINLSKLTILFHWLRRRIKRHWYLPYVPLDNFNHFWRSIFSVVSVIL